LYDGSVETTLKGAIGGLQDPSAANQFLDRYKNNRGMKVLLMHWLEIGKAIRDANATVLNEAPPGPKKAADA